MTRLASRATLWLLCEWLALAGCTAAPPPPVPRAASAGPSDAAALLRALDAEIGTAPCETDAQCRSLPIGFKACGGPQAYRAYSLLGARQADITALAQAQREASRRESRASGMVSNCIFVSDPGARCQAGHCVPDVQAGRLRRPD